MKTAFVLATTALAALLRPAAAYADTLVDTGTPDGGFTWSLDSNQSLAGRFALGQAFTITGLEGYFRDAGTVTATLYGDGTTPGATLFSTSITKGPGEAWAGTGGLSWAVGPGTYWLGFSTTSSMAMRDTPSSPLSAYAYTDDGVWERFDRLGIGIRVFGTPGTIGGVVPEPGTWALLLLGFGAIGAGMRASRRQQTTLRFAV